MRVTPSHLSILIHIRIVTLVHIFALNQRPQSEFVLSVLWTIRPMHQITAEVSAKVATNSAYSLST